MAPGTQQSIRVSIQRGANFDYVEPNLGIPHSAVVSTGPLNKVINPGHGPCNCGEIGETVVLKGNAQGGMGGRPLDVMQGLLHRLTQMLQLDRAQSAAISLD